MPDNSHPNDSNTFFIGYQPMPRFLSLFLGIVASIMVGGVIGIGMILALMQDDPGKGSFAFHQGYQTLKGILVVDPYPVLHTLPDHDNPESQAIILSGPGKNGVITQARPYDGQLVTVGGVFILRDDILMLQVNHRRGPLSLVELNADQSTYHLPSPLRYPDRVRLYGEIVDGKCYAGAMRPGVKKTHMSCANLCLIGGIPPLFITLTPSGTYDYFLLANQEGQALSEQIHDYVSLLVSVEGTIEQYGDLRVFRIDPETLAIL